MPAREAFLVYNSTVHENTQNAVWSRWPTIFPLNNQNPFFERRKRNGCREVSSVCYHLEDRVRTSVSRFPRWALPRMRSSKHRNFQTFKTKESPKLSKRTRRTPLESCQLCLSCFSIAIQGWVGVRTAAINRRRGLVWR